MTTTVKSKYGTATAITCTTTSLGSSSSLLAGRQSNQVDNTADLAVDAIVGGTIATTGTPTNGTVIEVWFFGSWDNGSTRTAGMGASDAAITIGTVGGKTLLAPAITLQQDDTTARTHTFGPISVAEAFGGVMPDHWGVFITHNTGTTLGATALKYTPINYDNV